MRTLSSAVLIACASPLAGCAHFAMSSHSYDLHTNNNGTQSVFIWDSKYSAGIGTENGICAQGALTAVANSGSAGVKLADRTLPIEGTVAAQFAQSLTALNATSTQTAYANIGYFYVCQIALNDARQSKRDHLTNEQIMTMFNSVGQTAANLSATAVTPTSITSPEAIAVVKQALDAAGVHKSDEDIKSALTDAQQKVDAPASSTVPVK